MLTNHPYPFIGSNYMVVLVRFNSITFLLTFKQFRPVYRLAEKEWKDFD